MLKTLSEATNSQEELWRYFSLARFIWTVENSRLYFAAPEQFDDAFEGATAVMPPDFPLDPRFSTMEFTEQAFFRLRSCMKINCWHRAEYESDAMWKLYAQQGKGIAICTTVARLQAAAKPYRIGPTCGEEDLWHGPVSYEDLTLVRLQRFGMQRFFTKHRAFAWEQEYRLIVSLEMASEFVPGTPRDGIEVEVDLESLIEQIVLGPELSGEEMEIVFAKSNAFGLQDRVRKSSLRGKPRFI